MKRSLWIVALLATAGGVCLAQSEAPSLGDVARQIKKEKKAVLVVTDDDVVTAPASASATAGSSAAAAAASGNTAGPEGNAAGKEKSGDHAASAKDSPKVAELKSKRDSLKEQEASWQNSAKRYEDLLANETSDFRQQMYQDALDNDRKNVVRCHEEKDRIEAELAKAQQASGQGSANGQGKEVSSSGGAKQP